MHLSKIKVVLIACSFFFCMNTAFAEKTVIKGAGATFPKPLYERWGREYELKTGVALEYEAKGSGFGVKQIEAGAVDFGASDKPVSDEDIAKYGLIQFPLIIGGIVPIINIPDVGPGELKLSGAVLADIYLGKIKVWNDKAIVALNPTLKLTDIPIKVVHGSGASGTAFLFSSYLSQKSDAWKTQVGNNTEVSWPTGIEEKGNEGVAASVKNNPGSIGYVEYSHAVNLNFTLLENKSKNFVKPSVASIIASTENTNWTQKNYNASIIDQPGDDSWPIVGASYILINAKQIDSARAQQLLQFFNWCFESGDHIALKLYYVPLPYTLIQQITKMLKTDLKDTKGASISNAS